MSTIPQNEPLRPATEQVSLTDRKRRRTRRRWLLRLAFGGAVIGVPAIFKLDCMFYHPDDVRYFEPREFGVVAEDVYFTTRDGVKLHGWWLPATMPQAHYSHPGAPGRAATEDGRHPPRRAGGGTAVTDYGPPGAPGTAAADHVRAGARAATVVHFHGNAANITNHVATVYWLPPAGYNVLMFDYRGYGKSQGRVTRAGTIADGHAALDYVLARPDVDPARVFVYGHSLGGAVALVVAAERAEVRGVVVEQTFGDYRALAAEHLRHRVLLKPLADAITWWTISKGFDAMDVVAKIAPRPLLVIASEQDSICFEPENRRLFDAAGEPKEYWCVPGAGHYGILDVADEELKARVLGLFERAAGR